jgi:hypothetical protein
VGNGVAGYPPWAAPRVLRGERPRAHGDVDPLHLRAPRVGEAPGRTGAAVGSGVSWPSGAWGFLGGGFDFWEVGFLVSLGADLVAALAALDVKDLHHGGVVGDLDLDLGGDLSIDSRGREGAERERKGGGSPRRPRRRCARWRRGAPAAPCVGGAPW